MFFDRNIDFLIEQKDFSIKSNGKTTEKKTGKDPGPDMVWVRPRMVTTPDGFIGVINFIFFDPRDVGPGGWHRPDQEVKI